MTDRPILFNAPMVRAILDGTKTQTQTRRVVKGAPTGAAAYLRGLHRPSGQWSIDADVERFGGVWCGPCPYGRPRDRLWVREAFMPMPHLNAKAFYRASDPLVGGKWRPSIHMPRALSRITLEVITVRVEALQDISESDAIAEGIHRIRIGDGYDDRYSAEPRTWSDAIEQHPDVQSTPRAAFRDLWESINGAESWRANPWVWVVEFKRVM